MCEALKELMKDEFEKEFKSAETRGEARGEAKGEIKGAIKLYHDELELMPAEIIRKIMIRFDLKQDAAEKYVEETLGLQMA